MEIGDDCQNLAWLCSRGIWRCVCASSAGDRRAAFPWRSWQCGAFVRRETQGEWEHFFLATYWNNLDAVIAFAGEDYHVAVTYADDERFQLLSDPYVFQFEVADVVAI